MLSLSAACVFAMAVFSAALRLDQDRRNTLVYAPYQIVPEGQARLAQWVKDKAPKGRTLLYVTDDIDYWQFWMWQRLLYPDNRLVAILRKQVHSSEFHSLRNNYQIDHVLLVGKTRPQLDFKWQVASPAYLSTAPVTLGELAH